MKAIRNFDTNYNVCFSNAVPMIAVKSKNLRDDGIIKISVRLKSYM